VFSKNLKNILILVLIGLLAISVWFNYVLYKDVKNFSIVIKSLEDDETTMHESIIGSLNNSCDNFDNRNSTLMSLASVLSTAETYSISQIKLVYFYCDILKRKRECEINYNKYKIADNVYLITLSIFKKYINNEITKDKFNSIVCNLTRYFENNNIEAIKKLRENV